MQEKSQDLSPNPIWDPPPPWFYCRWICWDPLPPWWLELDDSLLDRFARVELEFKRRELEIQMEKLQALEKMLG